MAATVENLQIVVGGLGLSGQASIRFLQQQPCQLRVWDSRATAVVPEWVSAPVTRGEIGPDFWAGTDYLVLSPGMALSHPAVQAAYAAGVKIIGEIELFAWFNRTPVLGITGSNGKTTVTMLVTHILQQAGLTAIAAGNVGIPAVSTLEQAADWVVLELSSFQLETTHSLALHAATILNISDDHLDRHGTLAAYSEAKQRIYQHTEHAVCWRAQQMTYPLPLAVTTTEFGFGPSDEDCGEQDNWLTWQGEPLVDLSRVPLMGRHNWLNIQAAVALAILAGVEPAVAAEAVYSFTPVAHRCERVPSNDGIIWIDDSKATNIGAAVAAIESFGQQKTGRLLLIAGGDAKGADLTQLQPVLEQHIDELITLGKDGPAIAALMPAAMQTASMAEAVAQARELARPGDTVLLAPACASLDMFTSYVARAEAFITAIGEGSQ